MSHDGDFMIFEGNRYSRKGFLFKSFAMSAVVRRPWEPSAFGFVQSRSSPAFFVAGCCKNDVKLESASSHPDNGWSEADPVRAGEV